MFLFKSIKVRKSVHTGSIRGGLPRKVPLWGPRCHIAHTHSPNAANRAPPVPPAPHPTTIPWPWGSDALLLVADYRCVLERPARPAEPASGTPAFSLPVSHRLTDTSEPPPPSLSELAVRLPLPASQSWASWSHDLRSFSLAFTTTPKSNCGLHSVFPSFWTPLASLRKLSHFLSSLLRFTHLDSSCSCPVKDSQPGEAGRIPCFACQLHPLMSGEPSSTHCMQCWRGSGTISQGVLLPLARSWHVSVPRPIRFSLANLHLGWTVQLWKATEELIPSVAPSQTTH